MLVANIYEYDRSFRPDRHDRATGGTKKMLHAVGREDHYDRSLLRLIRKS